VLNILTITPRRRVGERRYSSTILDLGTRLRRVVNLPTGKEPPGTHWAEGWVSPRAGLDKVKGKISYPCRESNPGSPVRSPSPYRLSQPGRSSHYTTWMVGWLVKYVIKISRGLISGTIPAFIWRDWENPQTISDCPSPGREIWTRDLPKSKQEWYPLNSNFRLYSNGHTPI
jgi:hypothetical protein